MLIIKHMDSYKEERKYIYTVFFKEFLGLKFEMKCEEYKNDSKTISIEYKNKILEIEDIFFQYKTELYLKKESLPKCPLDIWETEMDEITSCFTEKSIPIIYGNRLRNNRYIEVMENKIRIGIDILGSAFFMLTCYEELVVDDRDMQDRFLAKHSLAYNEGFLERPIINEYLELLWWSIHKLWPDIKRKKRDFQFLCTHDVDQPYSLALMKPSQLIYLLGGDLLKRKSLNTFIHRLIMIYKIKKGNWHADENYTFDLIMDISEENYIKSYFYIMTAEGLSEKDGNYSIQHPEIIKLLKNISVRGHEIGIHPSYISYKNGLQIKTEIKKLQKVLSENGIDVKNMGGRQHYLRWKCPDTWQYYEDAGLKYDTTLGYADHIGFRCGICYEYPVYNIKTKMTLQLKERPLIVMDCSALDKIYMNLLEDIACQRILKLKEKCKKYDGDFTILWHNNSFIKQATLLLYRKIIKG